MAKVVFGLCQMMTVSDLETNLRTAEEMVARCVEKGAQIVVLPEYFCSPCEAEDLIRRAQPKGGQVWQCLSALAKKHSITLIGGSMPELEDGKIYNTCFVFDKNGEQIARHRKVHLFDIDVKGGQYFKESATVSPGNDVTVFQAEGITVGVGICFDMRFPDMARVMMRRGAQVIVYPSEFNMTTGPAHWDMSLRMRALDNQVYAMGCSPARNTESSYVAYGYSLVASPWGDIRGKLDEKPGILIETVDTEWIDSVREQLPLISAMRTDRYTLPDWKD